MAKRKAVARNSRAKAPPPQAKAAVVIPAIEQPKTLTVQNGEVLSNDLSYALGYVNTEASGFPINQGTGWSEQVSNVNTIFKNLRWYLVSNFRQMLCQVYVELGLVQTIVQVPVDDALRGGIEIESSELDEDDIKQLQLDMKQEGDLQCAGEAGYWNRLFGGGFIMMLTGDDMSQPLELDDITDAEHFEFRSGDLWELFYDKQNTEGYDATLQSHTTEFYNYYGIKVHSSRVMILKGLTAPSFIRPRLRGWGFSVVEKLVRSLNQALKSTDLAFEVLDEFKLDVFKIKNLTNTLMSPVGMEQVRKRIQLAQWQKNYQNALTMDSEDDFSHKQLSFAGLADIMKEIRMQVASDMRMPLTKIYGIGAQGFNSGQDDIEVYNSMVESEVRAKLEFPILRMVQLRCQRKFGFVPQDIEIKFKPLRVLGAEQEEIVKTSEYNRVLAARTAGEITRHEFREAVNKKNLLPITLDTTGDDLNTDDPDIIDVLDSGEEMEEQTQDGEGEGTGEGVPKVTLAKGGINPKKTKDAKTVNSNAFDRKYYELDGGDNWIDPRRESLFKNPKDKGLWDQVSQVADTWQYRVWLYKKRGGSF